MENLLIFQGERLPQEVNTLNCWFYTLVQLSVTDDAEVQSCTRTRHSCGNV